MNKKKARTNVEESLNESVTDDCIAITVALASNKRRWVDNISDLSVPDQQPTLEAFSDETSAQPGTKKKPIVNFQ